MLVSLSSAAQTYSKELKKSAKKGDIVAQRDLGICYYAGNGIEVDKEEALEWLNKAANSGDAMSLYYIGKMYEERQVSGENSEKAWQYYKEAAEKGIAEAQYKLGMALLEGKRIITTEPNSTSNKVLSVLISSIKEQYSNGNITKSEVDALFTENGYNSLNHPITSIISLNDFLIAKTQVTGDSPLGKYWLEKAAQNGHQQAIRDLAAIREKEIQDSLAQVRIEEERLRVQEEERKRIQEEKLKWGNLSVQLKKPGTLLSVIPIDKLQYIDSLTITGILYETDLKVITEQCKGLKKLDLSNCYTLYSPEELKKQRDQQEAFVGLVKAMGVAANMKYNDYDMSTNDYVYTKLFTKLVEQAGKETKSDDACVIPNYAFGRMPCLEEIVFPTRCSEIGRYVCYECTQLKKVILPKYVKRMDFASFSFCRNLAEIEFPSTLKSIGLYDNSGDNRPGSFTRTGIKVVDLSKCNFSSKYSDSWTFFFTDCPNIQAVYLPNGVPNIDVRVVSKGAVCYVPASVKYLKYSCFSEYHFKSLVPPSGDILPKNCTIYVPKGCTTAYFAKYGSSNKYIEE